MKHLIIPMSLAFCLASINQLPAQQSQPVTVESTGTTAAKNAWDRQVAELVFIDMTYEHIAQSLSHHFPEFNIIVEEGFRKEVAPAIRIRNSRIHGILAALEAASPNTRATLVTDNIVSIGPRTTAVSTNGSKPILRTFNLSGYLAGREVKARDIALVELRELLAESWGMLQDADSSLSSTPPPSLRVHAGTQMLISVGTPEQLQVLEEIVYNLPGMSGFATDPATGAPVMVRPLRQTETSPAVSR